MKVVTPSDSMKLKINVTPLYGARSNEHAIATLLELDGLNILLDCGWNSSFDPAFLNNLAGVASSIHVILLSHPDITHLGALPYATSKLGLTAPVFSTLPVWRMGQMFMYNAYISQDAQKPFSLFNLDDVDATFDYSPDQEKNPRFTLLKYQQGFPLDAVSNGSGVVITPHRAGHMIGGTVWNITKATESIVYAVHVNHRKDRHLSPTTLVNFSRPSHLILSATNALVKPEGAAGEEQLVRVVKRCIKRGGNVLVPVDTAGRVIELAVQLDGVWEHDETLRESQIPLIVLHALSTRTFDFARSMIEWASDEFMSAFDVTRKNLFQFKHVRLVQDVADINGLSEPAVVLASPVSLETGPARALFARWAGTTRNAVVLVDRAEPSTLYSRLYERAQSDVGNDDKTKDLPLELDLVMGKKVPLEGEELDQWRERERTRKRLDFERRRRDEEEAQAAEDARIREEESAKRQEEEGEDPEISNEAGVEGTKDVENRQDGDVDMVIPESDKEDDDEDSSLPIFEHEVLERLRELNVIPTRRSDRFEYEAVEKVEWDEYGQKIDAIRFIIGEDPGEGGMFEDNDKAQRKTDGEAGEVEVVPTKHVEENVHVVVRCELTIANCTGISDGDSIRHLVKEVEPRHVTIVAGSEEETTFLGQLLKKSMVVSSIIAMPKVKETIDMSSDVSVYQVSLDDRLVRTVAWENVGLARVGFVNGRMTDETDTNGLGILGPNEIETDADGMDIEDDSNDVPYQGTYFVGSIMLNKLKDKIAAAGLKAEYAGGAICVENAKNGAVVLVRKVAGQHIILQGSLCEEYFSVRDLLYHELITPR